MKSIIANRPSRRVTWVFLFLLAGSVSIYFFAASSAAQKDENGNDLSERGSNLKNGLSNTNEPADLTNFRTAVGGKVTPVIVELNDEPGAVLQFRQSLKIKDSRTAFEKIADYAVELSGKQDQFREVMPERGVRLLMRTVDAKQVDGSIRRIEYRFTYLLNGFVAYVANEDLERLKEQPEVSAVSKIENTKFLLDNAIDYSLGTQSTIAARRLAVFGGNEELTPQPIAGHPENPRSSALDGFEGQGMNLAVIDSGVDWRHPMFGGTGNASAVPRVSGNPARSTDNRKVIYYYSMSSPGDPTDDFGHGTLVSSTAAGYKVDANTPRITGFFNGVPNADGTPGTGIGPTPGGTFFGTAPQARIMGYKVCGPAPQCPGDIPLSMEDAASPYTLVTTGMTAPTPVAKPVADVINLSLGDTSGSATAPSSRAANNAALNGTNVVASAGNAGPGAGTIGAPSAATLAISVAASLDPGSVAGGDLLAGDQIPAEPCDNNPTRAATCDSGTLAVAGPPAEYGAASNANAQTVPPFNFKLFPVAGGGAIRQGSVSGHYVYVDASVTPPIIPDSVTNRVAIVKFTGTFASGANPVALKNPAAILLISATESATAVQVINGIPTFTISVANADILLDRLVDGDANGSAVPPNGAVSLLPIRASESTSLGAFTPAMASFSSRGPNDHPTANFRQIKPDVTAPGVGVGGAATPEGLPDDTVGLASTTGYTQANGTSFSGPITAGAVTLVRQRVRTQLGLDTTNLNDANYRAKRYDAVTVTRALLQNAATNLRTGVGEPETDPAPSSSINDLGSGHINVAGALDLKAIMVSPTLLLRDGDSAATGDQREFNVPTRNAPTLDAGGNLEVLLPTASFGNVAVAGLQTTATRTRKVIIRDVTRGGGGGTYNLTSANNRNVDGTNFAVSFLAANGTTPITSVQVPSGGTATFFVRAAVNGATAAPDTEFQWYVYATHAGTPSQQLRMPFYYRATAAQVSGAIAAPNQTAPTAFPGTPLVNGCSPDADGAFALNWTYTKPAGGPDPIGFRIQQATSVTQLFFDAAETPPNTPANTTFAGSNQWISQLNPGSGTLAYFIADAAMQNESLTMINAVTLPAGGATLTYLSNENTEPTFDFANVEISNNGTTWVTLGSSSGTFTGTRQFDLSPYAGGAPIKIRFRFTSDLANDPPPPVGWYVENIRITSDNFATAIDVPAVPTSAVLVRPSGSYSYRIGGIFNTMAGSVIGPYSNTRCVAVP